MKKTILKTVLIVEDDHESNQNIVFFLQNDFKKTISAYNGLEGWNYYVEELPDLIITDIQMPLMNGLDLIKKIRQHDFDTPIILLSAYEHCEFLKEAIPLNVIDYIVKPLTFQKLANVMKKLETRFSFMRYEYKIDPTGNIYYDWNEKIVYQNEKQLHLTYKEIQMLELFLSNKGQIVDYDHIGEFLYPDALDSRNAVKCIIRDLRKKIPLLNIQSLPKIGYKIL